MKLEHVQVAAWFWILYHIVVGSLIMVDLRTGWKGVHRPTVKSSMKWIAYWISFGVAFGILVLCLFGLEASLLYYTAYIVEYSLSMDNLFAFSVIFTYFAVPLEYQMKTLYIGILAAIVLRCAFIAGGLALIEAYRWVIYIFAAILIYTGYKLFRAKEVKVEPDRNPLVRLARKFLPLTNYYDKAKFITRNNGALFFTPLVLVVLAIGSTDIMFAFDSVPTVIAITMNFFIAYTSNVAAVLGLRSLYFLLAIMVFRLKYLGKGLSVILVFLGLKLIVAETEIVKIPTLVTITIVFSILGVSAIASIMEEKRERAKGGIEISHSIPPH
jgi:tellurite resistance protein TerC